MEYSERVTQFVLAFNHMVEHQDWNGIRAWLAGYRSNQYVSQTKVDELDALINTRPSLRFTPEEAEKAQNIHLELAQSWRPS